MAKTKKPSSNSIATEPSHVWPQETPDARIEPGEFTPDDYLKLDNQLCFPLYAASRLMTNAYRPLLTELGLTYPQYLVLLVLWENDGLSVGEVGERLHLDSATLTPLLKRLADQGLVERRRSADDERVVHNWLSADGQALKARAFDIPTSLLCQTKLELPEVMSMKAMLDCLIAALLPLQ